MTAKVAGGSKLATNSHASASGVSLMFNPLRMHPLNWLAHGSTQLQEPLQRVPQRCCEQGIGRPPQPSHDERPPRTTSPATSAWCRASISSGPEVQVSGGAHGDDDERVGPQCLWDIVLLLQDDP